MDSTMTKIHNRHSNNEDSIGLPVHILQLYTKEKIIFNTYFIKHVVRYLNEKNRQKTIAKRNNKYNEVSDTLALQKH